MRGDGAGDPRGRPYEWGDDGLTVVLPVESMIGINTREFVT